MSTRKTITKKMASTIEIEVSDTGFTLWLTEGKNRYWLVDGSCVKDDGLIRIGRSDLYRHRAEFDRDEDAVRITRKR